MPLELIEGTWNTREVTIGGKKLSPKKSQKIINHSPNGFMWGYSGSGPAQLALAILLEITDKETAERLYQDFKREFIAELEQNKDFVLPVPLIKGWIIGRLEWLRENA